MKEKLIDKLNKNKSYIINLLILIFKNNNINAYLVGGAVRDLLLDKEVRDIDIAIEGDPQIVIKLTKEYLSSYSYHSQFYTATLHFKNGESIDIIRCRKEIYPFYGSLPIVTPSSIHDDLYRRDFTLNAIAYNLLNNEIIDNHFGIKDLFKGELKKVHKDSYLEDATRILRGIRYSQRYDFTLVDENEIVGCVKDGILKTISTDRMIKELCLICNEDKWKECVMHLNALDIFNINYDLLGKVNPIENSYNNHIKMLNIFYAMNKKEDKEIFTKSSIVDKELKIAMNKYLYEEDVECSLHLHKNNYNIYNLLKKTSYYYRIILAWNNKLQYKIINFEERLKDIQLSFDGNYIRGLSDIKGKEIGDIIEWIKKVKLCIGIKEDKDYLKKHLGEIRDGVKYKDRKL
ncbi:CCA tRNA nucleotidyltransferase [uncultured Clostridium sp.]|uniref:CCA tRNA nucleotidyltransferase n=1 Tax=uncultured Clostridium sp. TaxID=59620 RepID=UPI0028E8B056|nr:CCA tRNA nucleotidyltransferase [uncultured Clostridium sp.]